MEMIRNLVSVQAPGLTHMDALIWVTELMRIWLGVQQSMGLVGFWIYAESELNVQNYVILICFK